MMQMHFFVNRLDWMNVSQFGICYYLCFPCPVQIGSSQCYNAYQLEWKHSQVSSGYLEMSSLQGAFCHSIDVPGISW